jgi:hypothetical protein
MRERVGHDAPDMVVVEPVDDPPALALSDDQPSVSELAEVVRQAALSDGQFGLKCLDVGGPLAVQPVEDGEPDRMRHAREQPHGGRDGVESRGRVHESSHE